MFILLLYKVPSVILVGLLAVALTVRYILCQCRLSIDKLDIVTKISRDRSKHNPTLLRIRVTSEPVCQ